MKKTAIVTGASGDIGTAISKCLIENNYRVIGIYNTDKSGILSLKEQLGDDFHIVQCDLSDFDGCKKITDYIDTIKCDIDLLVNNAGISMVGLLQDLTVLQWNHIWNINVTSVVSLSRLVIPYFLKKQKGQIINISSVWGNCGASCEVAYSTTKGAVNTFTKALAKELAPSNIQVNAIACGIIDTKMNSHLSPDDIYSIIEDIPSGRIGNCEDIARAVLMLVNSSTYMTGQIITVDGGWTV
jgi:3-oxoacyl-[acyl-carrier protein] reductase